jgi:hypothetical protein
MSKQGISDKRKHTTLMIPQKLEIIRRLGRRESQSVVRASKQHWIINYMTYRNRWTNYDNLWLRTKSVKSPFK